MKMPPTPVAVGLAFALVGSLLAMVESGNPRILGINLASVGIGLVLSRVFK